MKYFTIKELSHSDTAVARGIDNTPTGEVVHNLTELVENVLDPLREKYGKPIRDHPQGTAFRPADRREGFLLGACVIPHRQKQKTGIKTLKLFSYGRFTAI